MTLCVSALIASEFMPVSLLTPIASDLHLTDGQAGQAISISGVFAVLTSLFVSGLTRRMDRRSVLLGLTLLMVASGAIVALAAPAPVGWGTWLSKILPHDAEAGGGLMVAVIQLAITLGASLGGFHFDRSGFRSTFALSAALLFGSALFAFLAWRGRIQRV